MILYLIAKIVLMRHLFKMTGNIIKCRSTGVLIKPLYPVFQEIGDVFPYPDSVCMNSMKTWDLVFSGIAGMDGILQIVPVMFVITIINVRATTAYPGNMCVMEDKIVHSLMMNITAHIGIVVAYSNVNNNRI